MEEDRGVLESYEPCQEDEIRSCNRIEVDFNIIDQSNRLKVFCTSVESKFDASEQANNDTRFYEVNEENTCCQSD